MSLIKKLISSTYPLRMKISKLTGWGIRIYENKNNTEAPQSFYSLKAILNTGEEISFEQYKEKKYCSLMSQANVVTLRNMRNLKN